MPRPDGCVLRLWGFADNYLAGQRSSRMPPGILIGHEEYVWRAFRGFVVESHGWTFAMPEVEIHELVTQERWADVSFR